MGGKDIFGTTRADVLLRFLRGKLAPIPALGADILANRTVSGDKPTISLELQQKLLPLMMGDIMDAYKEGGVKRALGVGIPITFGVSVQTYGSKEYVQSVMDKRKESKKKLTVEEKKAQKEKEKIGKEERRKEEALLKEKAEKYGIEYIKP